MACALYSPILSGKYGLKKIPASCLPAVVASAENEAAVNIWLVLYIMHGLELRWL
jgi:hypothetical protein